MADMDRDEVIDMLLEHVGVKAAGVTADTNDATLVGRIVDSVHARLDRRGLVPFSLASVPEWAQLPFVQVAAAECVAPFQLGPGMKGQIEHDAKRGLDELRIMVAVGDQPMPTVFEDF